MKKYFDRDRLYILLLLVCLLGSCLFGGAAIMIFDDGRYTFERMKFATLIGAFFPCLLVAVLLFYVLMKKTGRWQMALWVFLLPIVVEGFAYYYFENGYFPSEYLPQDDYRYFRGTPAYDLVHDIVKGKGVEDNAMEAMNYRDTVSGMTPLLFCIRKEYYADAVQLLEKGASPNIVDGKRNTSPLMELCQSRLSDSACSADKQRVLFALLEKGAEVNYRVGGEWPLMILCSAPHLDSVWCNLLIEHGADLNLKYVQQDEYQHECYKENETVLNRVVYNGNFLFAKRLIEQGADTTGYRDWMLDVMQSKHADSPQKDSSALSLLEYLRSNR